MKTMNKKHILIAAAVAGIAILAGGAMLSSSWKKQALSYYDELKEQFLLENVLSEGDISYSFWSGNLTVESPEIRLVAAQTNGAEKFLTGLMGLMGDKSSGSGETGLVAWSRYLLTSATGNGNAGGVYLKADKLKVSRSGDDKKGEIHVQLLGMDMGTPYVSHKGSEIVLPVEVADEIQPRGEIGPYGSVVKSPYTWGSNVVQRLPFTGAFITGATGEFGTKVDLDFLVQRSNDGEGSIKFVVVHRNDGSEIGRIVREAKFASLPQLDDVQAQLKSAFNGFIMGAYSTSMGQAVIAEAAGEFARKTKVASYSLTYKDFDQLKDRFDEYKSATKGLEFAGFCAEAGFSPYESDFGTKAKDHSDSECAIAQKLATDGKFEETYIFKEDKTLFAGLFLSKSFALETN
ncbi:hypothetical protein [Pseudomonas mohnii]